MNQNCPPYNDSLCELQYLINGMTAFNKYSLLEAAISGAAAAVIGALVGGILSYCLYNASRNNEKKVREEEKIADQDNRLKIEKERQHRRNTQEFAGFLRLHSPNFLLGMLYLNKFRHHERNHPFALSESVFPESRRNPGSILTLKLESSAAFLTTSGEMRNLFNAVRQELEDDEYQRNPYKAGFILSALSQTSMRYMEDEIFLEGMVTFFKKDLNDQKKRSGPNCEFCGMNIFI